MRPCSRDGDRPLMRALIVDDEPVARKVLREELELLGSIDVVGEADNGKAALLKISSTKPDIVFLDIQMPVMGGFEVSDRLEGGHMPVVVMVTAYDQHAIRAFEAGAVDYLLKPIGQQRLVQAVDRAKRIARNPARSGGEPGALARNRARRRERPAQSPQDRRKARRRIFSAESAGGARLSGGWRSDVDRYRKAALHGHAKPDGDRKPPAE